MRAPSDVPRPRRYARHPVDSTAFRPLHWIAMAAGAERALSFTGWLEHVHLAEAASEAMRELPEATLIAGVGIEGDRYATRRGTYSARHHIDRQITLIEAETLDA